MRASGILMHISSLPQRYGIGTLGSEAYRFVDFLAQAHQSYWQVLPICPTEEGASPYQSACVFAGNPYLIDLDLLCRDGLLYPGEYEDGWGEQTQRVDYERLRERRGEVLGLAFGRFVPDELFARFCDDQRDWLEDYVLFLALRDRFGSPWTIWPEPLRRRRPEALEQARRQLGRCMDYHRFVQFKFFQQWELLRCYANSQGVHIIGDLPMYPAADSADVWANQDSFLLRPDGRPSAVSGCPPDAFAKAGQRWNTPLYRWRRMRWGGYRFWVRRMSHANELFDVVRLDHFQGFSEYYSIPCEDGAEQGHWERGPGEALFHTMRRKGCELHLLAEDLGRMTPQAYSLRRHLGIPGMRVLQFAFLTREQSRDLPHNCVGDTVVYTGTHDNNTALGWYDGLSLAQRDIVCRYLRADGRQDIPWALMQAAWATSAPVSIGQMQDLLELPGEARMNTPGTVGPHNWSWRMLPGAADEALARRLARLTQLYFRTTQLEDQEQDQPYHTHAPGEGARG